MLSLKSPAADEAKRPFNSFTKETRGEQSEKDEMLSSGICSPTEDFMQSQSTDKSPEKEPAIQKNLF